MMNFAIALERHGSAVLLELVGEFDMEAAPTFAQVVGEQLDRRDQCLVFDLDRLEYIDSRGIYALIEMLRAVHNRDGCASIVLSNTHIARIFALSGIASAFRFFPDRVTALEAAGVARSGAPFGRRARLATGRAR